MGVDACHRNDVRPHYDDATLIRGFSEIGLSQAYQGITLDQPRLAEFHNNLFTLHNY
jgi:hypothetical protein